MYESEISQQASVGTFYFVSIRVTYFQKIPDFHRQKITLVEVLQFLLVWSVANTTKNILDLVLSSFMHFQLGYFFVHCKNTYLSYLDYVQEKTNFLQCRNFFFYTIYANTLRDSLLNENTSL
jgi:hypothetical protein